MVVNSVSVTAVVCERICQEQVFVRLTRSSLNTCDGAARQSRCTHNLEIHDELCIAFHCTKDSLTVSGGPAGSVIVEWIVCPGKVVVSTLRNCQWLDFQALNEFGLHGRSLWCRSARYGRGKLASDAYKPWQGVSACLGYRIAPWTVGRTSRGSPEIQTTHSSISIRTSCHNRSGRWDRPSLHDRQS